MKLNRNLFYILLVIFISAVCMVVFTDSTSVISRVGTGLMTGSFMGMIGAVVNYFHQRSEYFHKLGYLCIDVANKLKDYQIEAEVYNQGIERDKKATIDYATRNRPQEEAEQKKMRNDFTACALRCQSGTYVPFFFKSTYSGAYEKLCDKIEFDYPNLAGRRLACRAFSMLGVKASPEEQAIVIGNPDEFYEYIRKSCVDYHDLIVYECFELSKLINDLCDGIFRGTQLKSTLSAFEIAAEMAMINVDPDKVRDVRKEQSDEIAKRLEQNNEEK